MKKSDRELMTQYGITCVSKPIYIYKKHRYDNLDDALRYAKIDITRDQENASALPEADDSDSPNDSHAQ